VAKGFASQTTIRISVGDNPQGAGHLRTAPRHPAECVDGGGPQIGVRIGEQAERPGHPHILGWTAFVPLAPITRQRVQRPGGDLIIRVIERGEKSGYGRLIHHPVEEVDAESPHNGLWMLQSTADSWQRRRPRG
jgi:hypothetical protein